MRLQDILRRHIRRRAKPPTVCSQTSKTFGYVIFDTFRRNLIVNTNELYASEIKQCHEDLIDFDNSETVFEVDYLSDKVEDYLKSFMHQVANEDLLNKINIGCILIAKSIIPELERIKNEARTNYTKPRR